MLPDNNGSKRLGFTLFLIVARWDYLSPPQGQKYIWIWNSWKLSSLPLKKNDKIYRIIIIELFLIHSWLFSKNELTLLEELDSANQ